ncbi:MAG: DNA topoisomerase IB [Paracoccaceae bacterium]
MNNILRNPIRRFDVPRPLLCSAPKTATGTTILPEVSGLRYYPDTRPGIRRRRCGRGFTYVAPDGTLIRKGKERRRIEKLAVPPAYEDVWISPVANGHLLATGYDARQRKQYMYHPRWAATRAETKFASLVEFGAALPSIRLKVRRDLARKAGEREFALAAAVALIDRLSLRAGSPVYARENDTYGALTLQRRHLRFENGKLRVSFRSKGGKRVRRQLGDRTLLRALEKISDLPGAELLSWLDDNGEAHSLGSAALNAYIAEAGGSDQFSAKTFRTWSGTVAAFGAVCDREHPTVKAMAEAAARRLHNTPAIARKSYIHPGVINLAENKRRLPRPARQAGLDLTERRLLAFLRAEQVGRS